VLHQKLKRTERVLDKIRTEVNQIQYREIQNVKLEEEFCFDKDCFQDFLCSICLNCVEDPVCCANCESLHCRLCLNINLPCPKCRCEFKESTISRLGRNALSRLKFYCPMKCTNSFSYEQKAQHFSECIYKELIPKKCSLCNKSLNFSLKEHSKTCENLEIKCLFCNMSTTKLDFFEHLDECIKLEKSCGNCEMVYPYRFQQAHSEYYCEKISSLKKRIADFIELY